MPTVHTTASESLCVPPLLVPTEGRDGKAAAPVTVPMRTQTTRNETALVIPPLVVTLRRHGGARPAHTDPLQTFSAAGFHHALVMRNNSSKGDGGEMCTPITEPLRTLTTAGHQSVVEWADVEVEVDECTLRMLEPAEIGLGMAFGPDYVVLGNKRVKARQYGNAVTPPVSELLGLALREAITGEELEPGRPSGSHADPTAVAP
jgi:DNA (cytosine-5)-methyltransferase 1